VKEKTLKLFSGLLPSADLLTSLEEESHDYVASLNTTSLEEQESSIQFLSEDEQKRPTLDQDRAQIISFADSPSQILIMEETDDLMEQYFSSDPLSVQC